MIEKNTPEISPRDKRRTGFFIVDNEVLDNYNLSPLAFTLYSWLIRYSSGSGAFLSVRAFAKRYGAGKETIRKAMRELTSTGLIVASGKSESGSHYYDLLPVDKTGPAQAHPGLSQTHPGSVVDPPPGLSQTPKKTQEKKTKKEDTQGTPPFLKEYQQQYLTRFKTLPRITLKEIDCAAGTIRDYRLTEQEAVDYVRLWGEQWREDLKYWPASLLKFDGELLTRLDKIKALAQDEDADLLAEMKRLFPDYVPKSERTA